MDCNKLVAKLNEAEKKNVELQSICNQLLNLNQKYKAEIAELKSSRETSGENCPAPKNSVMEFLLLERKQFRSLIQRLRNANKELESRIEFEKFKQETTR